MQLLGLCLESRHVLQVVEQGLRRREHLSHAVLQLPTEHDLGHHLRRAVMLVVGVGAGVGVGSGIGVGVGVQVDLAVGFGVGARWELELGPGFGFGFGFG